jgi:ribosomal protein L16 Arg81 hydroxylase
MTHAPALSFSSLIAPLTIERFHQDYFEKAHFAIARENPSFYGGLFSYGDVDRCAHVARESGHEIITVVAQPGSGRGVESYRGDRVTLAQLHRAFGNGDTISVSGLERLWPSIAELTSALNGELNAMATVNSYLTPAGAQGFSIHFDSHDVLILQVEGEKDWYLYRPSFELPLEAHRMHHVKPWFRTRLYEKNIEILETICLKKGDLLYIPRGLPHKAVATDQASLHLSVGIHPPSWLDILGVALELVGKENPELRRSLPLGFANNGGASRGLDETFRTLVELFARNASFSAAFKLLGGKTVSSQTFPPDGHFEQLAHIGKLDGSAIVHRRPGVTGCVIRREEEVSLIFAGMEVRGPLALTPAFEFVRNQESFRVSDLPGNIDDQAKLDLVRRLMVEGLLRRDDDPDRGG